MSVKLGKNGKFVAHLQLPTNQRDSNNKIIRREKTKSFKTKTAAEVWERYESSPTWKDYRALLKTSTQSNKKHGIEKFCVEHGDRPISEVAVDVMEDAWEIDIQAEREAASCD